jgi:hypothetical protein
MAAAVESTRYSRFGPAHRALKVQVLRATTVSSWNNGPPSDQCDQRGNNDGDPAAPNLAHDAAVSPA